MGLAVQLLKSKQESADTTSYTALGWVELGSFEMGCHNINTAMFYMSGFQILCTVHFCNFFALTHLTPDNYSRS